MSPEAIARRVLVSGHVQGVAFRWSTVQEARRLSVAGWVRNLDDGRVEAHVEGPAEAVDSLIAWMRRGPRAARVETVEATDAAAEGLRGFEQR